METLQALFLFAQSMTESADDLEEMEWELGVESLWPTTPPASP